MKKTYKQIYLTPEFSDNTGAGEILSGQAFQYGLCAFEGILCIRSGGALRIFRLNDHIHRLFISAEKLGLKVPLTEEKACSDVKDFIRNQKKGSYYIRPLIFSRGSYRELKVRSKKAGFALMGRRFNSRAYFISMKAPKKLILSTNYANTPPRALLGAKVSGKYLINLLARTEALNLGAGEAVLLNDNGNISEASAANVFILKNNCLITPDCPGAIDGITKRTVIHIAESCGIDCKTGVMTKEDLYTADEVFLTSTAGGIRSAASIDTTRLKRSRKNITKKIRTAYISHLNGSGANIPEGWITEID